MKHLQQTGESWDVGALEEGGKQCYGRQRGPVPDQYVQLLALQLQVSLLLAQLLLQPVVEVEQGLVFAVILQGLKDRQPSAPSALKRGPE